jgi:hypothetical protein
MASIPFAGKGLWYTSPAITTYTSNHGAWARIMAIPLLNADNVSYFKSTVGQFAPESAPLWGEMNARRTVRHLLRAMEISLGEVSLPQKRLVPAPLAPVVWVLFFHIFTKWPEGKLKAPLPSPRPLKIHSMTIKLRSWLLLTVSSRLRRRRLTEKNSLPWWATCPYTNGADSTASI